MATAGPTTVATRVSWTTVVLAAVGTTAVATAIARALDLDDRAGGPVLYVTAVLAAATLAGPRAGIVATGLSAAALDAFFLDPSGSVFLGTVERDALVALILLLCSAALGILLFGRLARERGTALALAEDRRAALARADQALESLAETLEGTETGRWEWDLDEQIEWSDNLGPMHGRPRGWSPPDFEAFRALIHPTDLPELETLVGRAATTGEGFELEFRAAEAGGAERWLWTRATIVVGTGGGRRLVGLTRDASVHRRRARSEQLLARAGEVLARVNSADETYEAVARLAVPALAEWSVVATLEGDAPARLVAIAHEDPGGASRLRELHERYGIAAHPADPARIALDTGRSALVRRVDDAVLQALASDPAHLELLRSLNCLSCLATPIVARRRPVALLIVGTSPQGRVLDEVDLTLAEELAARAGFAIENAQLHDAQEQARRAAHAAAERTLALQQVTSHLSSAATVADVVQVGITTGLRAIGAQGGALGILSADGTTLARYTHSGDAPASFGTLTLDLPLPAVDVVRTGQALWFGDRTAAREAYPLVDELLSDVERSFCVLPLVAGRETLGYIAAYFTEERSFSAEDRSFGQTVAAQCAQALERARLLDRSMAAADRTRRLQRVTEQLTGSLTIREVARVAVLEGSAAVGAPAGFLAVLDDAGTTLEIVEEHGYPSELVDRFRRFETNGPLPASQAVRSGAPVWLATVAEVAAAHARADATGTFVPGAEGYVPLRVAGTVTGVLGVSFDHERSLTEDDQAMLVTIGRQCAQALENALAYEREHRIAETLQRALLPESLPSIERVAAAVRYVPGSDEADVGGDFYDLLELPGGRIVGIVGDIGGKGVRAAARMGQLRTGLHAYAVTGAPPAEVAQRLNALVEASGSYFATFAYVELDPDARRCRYTLAGHPFPVLLRSDGSSRYLDDATAAPLGVAADTPFRQGEVPLADGDVLVLYTDGLVERRGVPIDTGMAEVRRVAAEAHADGADPDGILDAITRALVTDDDRPDDIALLVLRLEPAPAPRFHDRRRSDPLELRAMRAALRDWLATTGAPNQDVDAIVLSASEAAANAIEHAVDPVEPFFDVFGEVDDGQVTVTIRDSGHWHARSEPRIAERGRGMVLMRALMDGVEFEQDPGGTRVVLRHRLRDEQVET